MFQWIYADMDDAYETNKWQYRHLVAAIEFEQADLTDTARLHRDTVHTHTH